MALSDSSCFENFIVVVTLSDCLVRPSLPPPKLHSFGTVPYEQAFVKMYPHHPTVASTADIPLFMSGECPTVRAVFILMGGLGGIPPDFGKVDLPPRLL